MLRSADLMLKTFHNFNQNILEERAKSIENYILQQDNLFDNQGFAAKDGSEITVRL